MVNGAKKYRDGEELKEIWVKKSTHKETKKLCAEEDLKFDEIIIKLIKKYRNKK